VTPRKPPGTCRSRGEILLSGQLFASDLYDALDAVPAALFLAAPLGETEYASAFRIPGAVRMWRMS